MSRNLRPKAQCEKAARTALAVIKQLEKAFHYRDRHVFVRLYIQYVRPHLEFAVPAWSPWTETDIACLERVQIKAVKLVTGLQGKTYEERLKELNLTTLADRRKEFDLVQAYKILHGVDNVDPMQWCVMAGGNGSAGVRTRHRADSLNIQQGYGRTEMRCNFFSNRVVKDWNSLPSNLKRASNAKQFKTQLRKFLRDNAQQ